MRLTTQQIADVERQTGAEPIAENNPAMEQLKDYFGDHTFYADAEGLKIFEPVEEADDSEAQLATVVQLAAWADDDKTALVPHRPVVRDVVVDLGTPAPDVH